LFYIIIHKATLDHCNEVAMVIIHDKSQRTVTPSSGFKELVIITSMLLIAGIKNGPGSYK